MDAQRGLCYSSGMIWKLTEEQRNALHAPLQAAAYPALSHAQNLAAVTSSNQQQEDEPSFIELNEALQGGIARIVIYYPKCGDYTVGYLRNGQSIGCFSTYNSKKVLLMQQRYQDNMKHGWGAYYKNEDREISKLEHYQNDLKEGWQMQESQNHSNVIRCTEYKLGIVSPRDFNARLYHLELKQDIALLTVDEDEVLNGPYIMQRDDGLYQHGIFIDKKRHGRVWVSETQDGPAVSFKDDKGEIVDEAYYFKNAFVKGESEFEWHVKNENAVDGINNLFGKTSRDMVPVQVKHGVGLIIGGLQNKSGPR